jgi:GT2 family glycosyltransferase
MTPRISVVVPCYNGAEYLHQALDSVLRQSLAPHEIIVVDDGSTDNSAEVAASYEPRVVVIRQQNRGEGGARNTGAAAASGTHLLFLDADDLIAPHVVEQLSAAARTDPEAMILMRSVTFRDDPGHPLAEPSSLPATFFPALIHTCVGVPHAWLTPRSVFARTAGFGSTQKYFVDWEFWCRAALLGPPLVTIPFVGALYRRHARTMSANTPMAARARGHVAVMETLASGFLERPDLLRAHGQVLFWCSWTALHRARIAGVAWRELERLSHLLAGIARQEPAGLRRTATYHSLRWLGIRTTYWLRHRWSGNEQDAGRSANG